MPSIIRKNVSLSYEVHGKGFPIVLGHSYMFTGDMWSPQIGTLAEKYCVVNCDLRGHGNSGPFTGPVSMKDLVDDVIAILDQENIDKAAWCGLSIGGMTAMHAAIRYPGRVAGLVLLGTHAGSEHPKARFKNALFSIMAKYLGMRPFIPIVRSLMFGKSTLLKDPGFVKEWEQQLLEDTKTESKRLILNCLLNRESILDKLSQIKVPTLVIHGEEDRALRLKHGEEIARLIPKAKFIKLPQCGHISPLEQPDKVLDAIMNFMKDNF